MIRITASLILLALATNGAAQQGSAPRSARPAATADKFLGARSCSATACHGNVPLPRSQSVKDSEYIYWLENDPHALALEALSNDRSSNILLQLEICDETGKILKPERYKNCLACHNVSPQLDDQANPANPDGVSCESCHGAAADWIDVHYTSAWQSMNHVVKSDLGFKHTYNLGVRAAICVTCHVGTPDQHVNHDMIAAGHPALKFELSAYHHLLPKHWNHDGQGQWPVTSRSNSNLSGDGGDGQKVWPERDADFELKLWRLGREESARAALELLSHRADQTKNGGIWPELAEYECFACHHELTASSWRHQQPQKGKLRWGSWYFANAWSKNTAVEDLRRMMQANLSPDSGQIRQATQRALDSPLSFEPGPPTDLDWDSLTQSYLASVAKQVARLDKAQTRAADRIHDTVFQRQKSVRSMLSFPPQYESPKDVDQNSSRAGPADPQTIRREIEAIFSSLADSDD